MPSASGPPSCRWSWSSGFVGQLGRRLAHVQLAGDHVGDEAGAVLHGGDRSGGGRGTTWRRLISAAVCLPVRSNDVLVCSCNGVAEGLSALLEDAIAFRLWHVAPTEIATVLQLVPRCTVPATPAGSETMQAAQAFMADSTRMS